MKLTPEHLGIFTGDMFQPLMGHIRALEEDLASAREREKAVDNQMRTLMATRNELMQAVEAAAYRNAAVLVDVEHQHLGKPCKSCKSIKDILACISPSAQSALDSMIAELKAQTAAMLEKVVVQLDYDISCYDENEGAQRIALQIFRDKVRALISTDYAEALTKRVQQAVIEEVEIWNNNAGPKRLDTESEWAKMRLASHRAACGMPFPADAKDQSRKE